ncbi:MAG: glycosyltransferase family 2 protein [Acidimicrobiales bacterium]|nr:glycosyltransferase family 2 protein [Acidimicrobiales bacterium]
MSALVPATAVIVPCRDEAAYLPDLLAALVAQVADQPGWRLILVDDSSTDATGAMIDEAADAHPEIVLAHHGDFGSPGAARSAAAAIALGAHDRPAPRWLLTTDVDVQLPHDWIASWAATLCDVHGDERVGAVNGQEQQDHLLEPFPNAQALSARFGAVVERSEELVGPTNLNGVNHAVRTEAYVTCGPYRQPMGEGPDGPVVLAGEDWDLGVRLRLAGYRIAPAEVAVADRGRRLLADIVAYLGGTAYEGAFGRVEGGGPAVDVSDAQLAGLLPGTARRALLHFYAKPLLAVPRLLDGPVGLQPGTVEEMRAWMAAWPSPSFTESRNGFLYGRLPRFVDAFAATVLDQLDLTF